MLKIMACLAVVVLHASVPVVFDHGNSGWGNWWLGMLVNASSRFAVPVFVMVSGALTLTQPEADPLEFWRRRSRRIVPLTIFWVSAYLLFFHFVRGDALNLSSIWQRVVMSEQYEHLYFLFLLAQLWVLTPFLWPLFTALKQRQLLSAVIFTSIITIFWQPHQFMPLLWIPYLSYYLWGGYAWQYRKQLRIVTKFTQPVWLISLYLGSVLNMALVTRWLTVNQVTDNLFFLKYQSPLVMISALAVFGGVVSLATVWQRHRQLLALAQRPTLMIYLLSPALLYLASQQPLLNAHLSEAWTILPLTALCLGGSALVSLLWQRVQYWYAYSLSTGSDDRRLAPHHRRSDR